MRNLLAALLLLGFGLCLSFLDFEPAEVESAAPADTARIEVLRIFGNAGPAAARLALPRAAVFEPLQQRLYVVDKSSRIVWFSPQGQLLGKIQLERTDRGFPVALDVDEQGNLWVADTHNFRVLKYSPDGLLLQSFGSEGDAPGQFGFVSGIAVGADFLVVCDYRTNELCRVQVLSRTGECRTEFGTYGRGPGQFRRPVGVALTPENDILIASGLTHRVQKFSLGGDYLGEIGEAGKGPGQMMYPQDVECLPDGRFLVTEYGNNRVQLFDADGRFLRRFGYPGSEAAGALLSPWGTAVDSEGHAYVVDYRNQRIQVVAGLLASAIAAGPGWQRREGDGVSDHVR